MTTRIKIKKGAGTPSGLTFGELAYDVTDRKLFIGITGGNALLANTDGGVASFNGITGAVTGVTVGGANTFTALNTFNAGISAAGGATFANDIKVNGVNIGLGAGNIASNLGIGKGALSENSGGLFNTAIGSGAMEIGTNSYSVAFGYNALHSCTGGGLNNVALGSSTMTTILSASSNVAIGSNSSQNLKDGNYNISIGGSALVSNTNGSFNIAIGHSALNTNGYDLNTPSNNIGIGYQALYTNDEGQQNTAIGNEALKSIGTTGSAERNTAIGYQAGRWKGTGTGVVVNRLNTANDSIFIGWRARSSADAQTNQIVIGNDTVGGGSNTTTIGTTASTDATIYGKLHGTNGVSGPTASFTSLTVSENTTLGNVAMTSTSSHTGLASFAGGLSAAGGVTLAGTFSGTTGSFSRLLTASSGISASALTVAGATFSGNVAMTSTSSHTGLASFAGGLSAAGSTFSGNVNLQDNTLSRIELLDYCERYVDLGDFANKGAQIPIDLSTGQVFRTKLTLACTGLSVTNTPDNGNANAVGFTLLFVGDGTARTMTWNIGSTAAAWAGGVAPTYTSTLNKIDVYSFLSRDGGSNWLGFVGGQNF